MLHGLGDPFEKSPPQVVGVRSESFDQLVLAVHSGCYKLFKQLGGPLAMEGAPRLDHDDWRRQQGRRVSREPGQDFALQQKLGKVLVLVVVVGVSHRNGGQDPRPLAKGAVDVALDLAVGGQPGLAAAWGVGGQGLRQLAKGGTESGQPSRFQSSGAPQVHLAFNFVDLC